MGYPGFSSTMLELWYLNHLQVSICKASEAGSYRYVTFMFFFFFFCKSRTGWSLLRWNDQYKCQSFNFSNESHLEAYDWEFGSWSYIEYEQVIFTKILSLVIDINIGTQTYFLFKFKECKYETFSIASCNKYRQ